MEGWKGKHTSRFGDKAVAVAVHRGCLQLPLMLGNETLPFCQLLTTAQICGSGLRDIGLEVARTGLQCKRTQTSVDHAASFPNSSFLFILVLGVNKLCLHS